MMSVEIGGPDSIKSNLSHLILSLSKDRPRLKIRKMTFLGFS